MDQIKPKWTRKTEWTKQDSSGQNELKITKVDKMD